MGNAGSTQVGTRLPGHIYRWLKEKVDRDDYPNMSQAVIGELTKAKHREEMVLEAHEPTAISPLLHLELDVIRELFEEMSKRKAEK